MRFFTYILRFSHYNLPPLPFQFLQLLKKHFHVRFQSIKEGSMHAWKRKHIRLKSIFPFHLQTHTPFEIDDVYWISIIVVVVVDCELLKSFFKHKTHEDIALKIP